MRTRLTTMGRIFCLALIPILFSLPAAKAAGYISGHATIVDGQHLKIGDRTLSLYGIDAPALDTKCFEWQGTKQISYACGEHAKAFLASMAAARDFVCVTSGGTAGDQVTCYSDGRDVAQAMVEAGWAVACDFASRYIQDATAARTARVGLWAGNFNTMGQCKTGK